MMKIKFKTMWVCCFAGAMALLAGCASVAPKPDYDALMAAVRAAGG